MSNKQKWGIPEVEPAKYVMVVYNGIITCHYKPPSNVMKKTSVPIGKGEYANLPDGEKLYRRARRRINKYSLSLFSTDELPDWFITFNYTYKKTRTLTADQVKLDLRCARKFFGKNYPDAGIAYSIDWEKRAKHHIHMLVWGIKPKPGMSPKKSIAKLTASLRKWWLNRMKSKKKTLLDVRYLPTDKDSIRVRNYLVSAKKIKAHMPVIALLGRKASFGFFNKKNIPFVPGEVLEVSPEEFDGVVRQMMLEDLAASKHSSKNAQTKRHKRKLKKGKSLRHRCHDRKLAKRIKNKLRKRNREM